MKDEATEASALNIGDSIGLLSLLFAVVAVVITPQGWVKALLLLASIIGIGIAVRWSHWTHAWPFIKRVVLTGICIASLLSLWLVQLNQRLISQQQPTLMERASVATNELLQIAQNTWMNHAMWAFAGAAIMFLGLRSIRALTGQANSRAKRNEAERGILDYKLLLEAAVSNLAPALEPITRITAQVGTMIQKETRKIEAAASQSTNIQIRVTRKTARKLDRFSNQINMKCSRLEKLGYSFNEGMFGLTQGATVQATGHVLLMGLAPSIKNLVPSIKSGIDGVNSYIAGLQSTKGVSRDMNVALDNHIAAITRVRDANAALLGSCISTLAFIEGNAPNSLS